MKIIERNNVFYVRDHILNFSYAIHQRIKNKEIDFIWLENGQIDIKYDDISQLISGESLELLDRVFFCYDYNHLFFKNIKYPL